MAKVVTWEPRTSGFLHSNIPSCTGEAVEGGPCVSCAGLLFNTGLGGVIARACNSELHLTSITNEFLTAEQQQARYLLHLERESLFRLMVFKGDQRVSRLLQRADMYKRILIALSEKNIKRVHALLLAELKEGSSPQAILNAIQKAVAGTRKATGNKDEVLATQLP